MKLDIFKRYAYTNFNTIYRLVTNAIWCRTGVCTWNVDFLIHAYLQLRDNVDPMVKTAATVDVDAEMTFLQGLAGTTIPMSSNSCNRCCCGFKYLFNLNILLCISIILDRNAASRHIRDEIQATAYWLVIQHRHPHNLNLINLCVWLEPAEVMDVMLCQRDTTHKDFANTAKLLVHRFTQNTRVDTAKATV